MKKKSLIPALLLAVLLWGCGSQKFAPDRGTQTSVPTESLVETVPPTVPQDGNPEDVTCKGSYTGEISNAVVAEVGEESLTGEELQVWYWAEVSQYKAEKHGENPDFDLPLDQQVCRIDDSVASWQQYFLREALHAWHTAAALKLESSQTPMTREEAYQPNLKNYEVYLTDIPATKYLYGFNEYYQTNTLHQQYLDTIPEKLEALAKQLGYDGAGTLAKEAFGTSEAALEAFVRSYNEAYMYFTELSYSVEPEAEELADYCAEHPNGEAGRYVDIRQILLVPQNRYQEPENKWNAAATEPVLLEEVRVAPDGTVTCSEEAWAACEQEAQEMLTGWQKKTKATEATFADIANKNSRDSGTALDGGAYDGIRQGQLIEPLDSWCFAPERVAGDTAVIRSEYGVHILYFAGSGEISEVRSAEAYYRQAQGTLMTNARTNRPMTVNYSAIALGSAQPVVSAGDLLYPDVAHERFPEVPLYLQQDYPNTKYGGFKITSNGCGITTMAMLASYMADDELTPPEMCARFGSYSHSNGTDGMIFIYEPAGMGFYLREKTYDTRVAKAALEEGQIVVSVQHPGYWTRAGHYIVCESINEEGLVQVRDSNIYNYGRIAAHKDDMHKWGNITAAGSGYWIFEDKVTAIPACARCGDPSGNAGNMLREEYTCRKCDTALLRRNTYLAALGE